MSKIWVNGLELYYEVEGSGEPLVLLHGLTGNHLMLQQERDYFKDKFRVVAVDLRGHGKSDRSDPYDLADHVQDITSLMNFLQIEKANLLVISMGAYVAQGLAIANPERIKRMVLVSGSSHAKKDTEGLLAEHAAELGGMTFEEKMYHLIKYVFHDVEAVKKWLEDIPSGLTPEEQERAAAALKEFDFRFDLPKVTASTLVINGKYDQLNPPEGGKEIAELIPDAEFVLFEESGHAPNVEEKEKFLALVAEFLTK